MGAMTTTNRVGCQEALGAEQANRSRRNMIARELDLDLSSIVVEDAPSNKAFAADFIGRGKIRDLGVTRGIVRTKITTTGADAT